MYTNVPKHTHTHTREGVQRHKQIVAADLSSSRDAESYDTQCQMANKVCVLNKWLCVTAYVHIFNI